MNLSSVTTVASPEQSAPDAAALVQDFVTSERSERAFERLVEGLGGLVYASAKRRTNDPQLAEEVAQNVFAILARKAVAVGNHPAPLAWIFQTTKHEACKAMRAARRRQRKHEALAQYQRTQDGEHLRDAQSWREALIHLDASLDQLDAREREVVLQRFFHDRKFREIAAATGQSEAACKMRLRRTLDKLARLLSARGVALSTTALASLLTAEMSKAAPATLVASSGQVLGSSAGLGLGTMISNTIHTMSTAKSATLTAVAVIVLAAGPALWQQSEARQKKERIDHLIVERDQLTANARSRPTARSSGRSGIEAGPRTVREMLLATHANARPEDIAQELIQAFSSQDIMGMLRVFMTLVQLQNEEVGALITAVENHPAPTEVKGMVLQVMAEFAPQHDARRGLEQALKMGVEPYRIGLTLQKWAQHQPQEALAWFEKNKADGTLAGKGLQADPSQTLYGFILAGMAQKDPAKAVALFQEATPEAQFQATHSMVEGLSSDRVGEDFRTQVRALVKGASNEMVESNVLNNALAKVQLREGSAAALSFLKEFEIGAVAHGHLLSSLAIQMKAGEGTVPEVAERGQWLLSQARGESRRPAIKAFVEQLSHTQVSGVPEWIESSVPANFQDEAWEARARIDAGMARHKESLKASLQISAGADREQVLQVLGKYWARRNQAEGREAFEQAGLIPGEYGFADGGEGSNSPKPLQDLPANPDR